MLREPYEMIGTVSAQMSEKFKGKTLDLTPLRKEGERLGADVVIGIIVEEMVDEWIDGIINII